MSGRQKKWILEVSVARLIFFIFRNEMRRYILEMERVSSTVNERKKWSVMGSSTAVRSEGVTPEQQIKSRVCPLECVGKLICCWHPKLSKQEVKSLVRGRLILSM